MAFHTIGDVEDAFFVVLVFHFYRFVAGVTGVLDIGCGVTGLTGNHPFTTMIQWDCVRFQAGGSPGRGAVAISTLHAKQSGMDGGFRVALSTLGGRPGKFLVNVTGRTFNFCVASLKDEETGMVEVVHPINTVMTIQTVGPILLLVFGHKDGSGLCMAGSANIEVYRFQAGLVAGGTVENCAGKVCFVMDQAKTLGVIESGATEGSRGPAAGSVAGVALWVEQSSMNSRLSMAGDTSGGRAFKLIFNIASGALCTGMFPLKRKIRLVVIKVHHAIRSIVTGQAIGPKILLVLRHKRRIAPNVAIRAGLRVHTEILSHVAVSTFQRSRVIIHLMPDQAEPGDRMVEVLQPGQGGVKISPAMIGVTGKTGGFYIHSSV